QHHRVRYALRDAIGYDCIDPRRRNRDNHEIDLRIDRCKLRVTAQSLVLAVAWVDGKDAAAIAVIQQSAHDIRSGPDGIFGSPHDGDRARAEQSVELRHLSIWNLINDGTTRKGAEMRCRRAVVSVPCVSV